MVILWCSWNTTSHVITAWYFSSSDNEREYPQPNKKMKKYTLVFWKANTSGVWDKVRISAQAWVKNDQTLRKMWCQLRPGCLLVGPKLKIPVKGCNTKPPQWPTSIKTVACECGYSSMRFGTPTPQKKVKKKQSRRRGLFSYAIHFASMGYRMHNIRISPGSKAHWIVLNVQ